MKTEEIISKRQQYLDGIVAENQSPYVNRVIYDHGGKIAIGIRGNYFENYVKVAHAATLLLNQYHFGFGGKSNIHIFDNAFGRPPHFRLGEKDVKLSREDLIGSILKHESVHAEQQSNGITLEDGLIVNGSTHYSIDSDVVLFVMEALAYLHDATNLRELGPEHSQYLLGVWNFFKWKEHSETIKFLKESEDFHPYDRKFVRAVQLRLDKVGDEPKEIFKKMKSLKR